MTKKKSFAFLLRPAERQALQKLADRKDWSQAATLRGLIREEARRLGLWSDDPRVLAQITLHRTAAAEASSTS